MDDSPDSMDIDWSQSAKMLPPNYIKKLGDMLSSQDLIQGSSWETVAHALNLSNEERKLIKVNADTHKMSEGYALLHKWTSGNGSAHSLQVLKTALGTCNRDDIMEEFMKAVQSMHEVTLHVVVEVPRGENDHETRHQRINVTVNSAVTLAGALLPHIANIREYEVTVPKYATLRSQAMTLKGNQITITKKSTDEDTGLKQISSILKDTAIKERNILGTGGNRNLIPNILPTESFKESNNILDDSTRHSTEEERCMPMPGTVSCECNNLSSCDDGCNSNAMQLPGFQFEKQNRIPGKEPNGTPWKVINSTKRPHPEDDESDDSNGDGKTSFINIDNNPDPEPNTNNRPVSQSVPNPHNVEQERPTLIQRFSDPGMSRRVKSRIYIPLAARNFDMAGVPYWHGQITMEQMEEEMAQYQVEDGWFMVWSYKGATEREHKLVISVTHSRQLLHYNIRARVSNGQICYYLFKKEYVTEKALTLLEYYSSHSLESWSNTGYRRDIRLLKPVPQKSHVAPLSAYFYVTEANF